MIRKLLVPALLLLLSGGTATAFQPELGTLNAVPSQLLPPATIEQAIESSKSKPLAFATGIAMNLTAAAGSWDFPQPDTARWRLRLASENALSLSFNLSELTLPTGGELWLYSEDGRDIQGPFTSAALLPLVRGNAAVLEARMPTAERSAFRLSLDQAYHGFRPFAAEPTAKGQLGDADGNCHVDAACADGNNWRDEIRSAVLYTRTESGLLTSTVYKCSGVLVNNTAQNNRALVLTANHCGITSSTRMANVKVYFNVQKSSCGSTGDGPINQVIAGKQLLARDTDTDFTLFELASAPPGSYNAYYAGWDARDDVSPKSGVGIHHPAGDDKKISTYTRTPGARSNVTITEGLLGSFTIDSWEVTWAKGVTEPGSSGSALWNQDHRVVGTLSGGSSSCNSPTQPDQYARLDRAWTANSTSTGQLKAHLDPTNSNSRVLNGRSATSSAEPIPVNSGTGGSGGSSSGGGSGGGALGLLTLAGLLGFGLMRRIAHR